MSTYSDASLIFYPSGYKESKLYSLKPTDGSGDLTFTRASTATRVNSSGLIESVATNVPRIDYTGGGCGKLLLEPQRTNLSTDSETFISWTDSFGSVTLNVATSPDGTTNAASYKDNNTGGTGEVRIFNQINVDAASAYTFSMFIKSSGLSQWAFLQATDYNGSIDGFAYFDILNGVVGINSNLSSTNIENYGDGWYRCSITWTQGAADTQVRSQFQVVADNGVKNVTRDGTNGYYVWAAQTEKGSYSTSYIPTTSTAVTRVADTSPNTSFLDYDSDFTFFYSSNTLNNGTQNKYYDNFLGYLSDFNIAAFNLRLRYASINYAMTAANTYFKLAIVKNSTNVKIFLDGVLKFTITTLPSGSANITLLESQVLSMMTFQTALSDDDLTLLTGTLGETYFESYALMANYLNYTIQ